MSEHIHVPPKNSFYTHTPELPPSLSAASSISTLKTEGKSVFKKLEGDVEKWLRQGSSAVNGQGRLSNIPLGKEGDIFKGVAKAELEKARELHPNASEDQIHHIAERQIYLSGQNGYLRKNNEATISRIIDGTPLTNMPDWQKSLFEVIAQRLFGGKATPQQLENLAETLTQKYSEALQQKQFDMKFNTTPNAPQNLFEEVGNEYAKVIEHYRNPQF